MKCAPTTKTTTTTTTATAVVVNPDLEKERRSCTFDSTELTYLLDGGRDKTKQRRDLDEFVLGDEAVQSALTEHPTGAADTGYLSYGDKYSRALERSAHFVRKIRGGSSFENDIESIIHLFLKYNGTVAFPDGCPIGVHFAMFIPSLLGQASDEQQSKWLGQAIDLSIIGCYAQTELGHGTFIRGLETTATYDPDAQEFVLNSPTLTATKWWPGCLGRTCTHAMVVAQLVTKGRSHGVHSFIVPIRSLEDHRPLPGIIVGEIGPKLAGDSVDNGYLRFDHVRIPRENMMMKHAKVSPDGTYVRPKSDKLGYGTMVFVRVIILQQAAKSLASAATIAVRYSAIRHQSEIVEGRPEPQILDFIAQQYKLFPLVAAAYGIIFAGLRMWDIYIDVYGRMQDGELDGMPELHALSSGLKALTTDLAANGVETCRLACGGHGYMQSAGFTRIYGLLTAACTYEGENTVLLLQTARYLMKAFAEAKSGRPVQSSVSYLTAYRSINKVAAEAGSYRVNGDLVALYQQATSRLVANAAKRLREATARRGGSAALAWNDTAFHLTKCARFHSQCFLVTNFHDVVTKTTSMSASLRSVLSNVYELYALHWIRENAGDFLRSGAVSGDNLDNMDTRIQELLLLLRPNIVTLVDAFDIRDEFLNSVLGCHDGRAYERTCERVFNAPINCTPVKKEDLAILKDIMQSKL